MVEGRHHVAGQLVFRRVQVHLLAVTLIVLERKQHLMMDWLQLVRLLTVKVELLLQQTHVD